MHYHIAHTLFWQLCLVFSPVSLLHCCAGLHRMATPAAYLSQPIDSNASVVWTKYWMAGNWELSRLTCAWPDIHMTAVILVIWNGHLADVDTSQFSAIHWRIVIDETATNDRSIERFLWLETILTCLARTKVAVRCILVQCTLVVKGESPPGCYVK